MNCYAALSNVPPFITLRGSSHWVHLFLIVTIFARQNHYIVRTVGQYGSREKEGRCEHCHHGTLFCVVSTPVLCVCVCVCVCVGIGNEIASFYRTGTFMYHLYETLSLDLPYFHKLYKQHIIQTMQYTNNTLYKQCIIQITHYTNNALYK